MQIILCLFAHAEISQQFSDMQLYLVQFVLGKASYCRHTQTLKSGIASCILEKNVYVFVVHFVQTEECPDLVNTLL